jgi:hypothetical protein
MTYDRYRHNGTLRPTNLGPTVPTHTPGEIWERYGEPHTRPRNISRPSRLQNLQATNPDDRFTFEAEFGPSESLDCPFSHQEFTATFNEGYNLGVRWRYARSDETSGCIVCIEPHGSQAREFMKNLDFVRRGSGKRAKFRGNVKKLFGIARL